MPEKFPSSEGKDFLKEKYSDLPNSPEVESAVKRKEVRTGEKPKNKEEKIGVYLDRLQEIFEHPEEEKRERRVDMLKDKLHDKFVIKPEEVPENYFNLQKKIAREQGHGNIDITDEMKEQMTDVIINDQEKSLDAWVDYLSSQDATYPNWLKYFAFRSIVGLSSYDKEKKQFKKRSKGTTAIFPDINREALAYVLDAVEKSHKKEEKQGATDEQWEKLLKTANFGKLYAHAIEKITPASEEEKEQIQGEWTKYNQGSDHKPLYESLQGHGTGWCTAGEGVAEAQLKTGDFYVFYSKDKKGNNAVPRVAIRMQEGEIAEVRGINQDQNLESLMTDIAKKKVDTLPGAKKYEKRTKDMKQLTEIEIKMEKQEELNKEELTFLHEIKGQIYGFGYQKDPRIKELQDKRDKRKDYSFIFDCKPEQIAYTKEELDDQSVVFIEYLNFESANIESMPKSLKYIENSADFGGSKIESLGQLQAIGGSAHLRYSQVKELGQLQAIGGDVYVDKNSKLDFSKVKIGGEIIRAILR